MSESEPKQNSFPKEWEKCKLAKYASVLGGKRLPKGHFYSENPTNYRYLRVTDFYKTDINYNSLQYLLGVTFFTLEHYEIHKNDLFISIAGSIGQAGVFTPTIQDRVILTENAARITVSNGFIPEFLAIQINGDAIKQQIDAAIGTGGGVPKLALFRIENLEVLRPEIEEQKKITSIIKILDTNIQKTEEKIAKLRQIKSAFLYDLLTRGVDENGELRDLEAHLKQFKDSVLGKIPKEWEVKSIGLIAAKKKHAIVDGPFGSNLKSEHYREKGVPVIQSGFVTSGKFKADSYFYVDHSLFWAQKRSAVEGGDIVMAKIGAQCGISAILPYDHPTGIIAGNCLKISPNNQLCQTDYLLVILQYFYNIGKINLIKTETAQPAISLKSLKNLLIPLPNLSEQGRIISLLKLQEKLISTEESFLTKLQFIKKGLTDDLLTGRVRVPENLGIVL